MNNVQIFEDIAQIITQDYAGAEEVKYPEAHVPFLSFCSQLAAQFDFEDEDLFNFVQLYLQVIGDRKLMFDIQDYAGFHHASRGFSVRSDGQELYVTGVTREQKLRPGDRVVQINQYPPVSFRSAVSQMRWNNPLSERDLWDAYLNHARTLYVEHEDASQEKVILKQYQPDPFTPEHSCRKMDADTVYLQIQSFAQAAPIQQLVKANQEPLASCSRLIVDLRRNAGGDPRAFLPLLPYLCAREMSLKEFLTEEEVYTRYTERNCDLSKTQITPYLEAENPQVREMAAAITAELEANRGRGLVLEKDDDEDERIQGCRSADQIILLTDTFCEDEAEWLALGCSRLDGITLVGRPTMGNMDYSNLVTVKYGYGITFTYPISKTKSCFEGKSYNPTGVPVDVYVPWSKAEIQEDRILQTALSL